MGPELDLGKRLNLKMEVPSYTSNENFAKELEDALMKFTTTYDDSKADTHSVEETKEGVILLDLTKEATDLVDLTKKGLHLGDLTKQCHGNADGEIDIMECKKLGGCELVDVQCHETTESSSSFGNSGSEDDTFGDEALSDFHGDMFRQRRKKLTPHWKSFIQPLVWRCKWTELKIKNLESQAKKYDRKLVEYSQQDHIQLESSAMEGIGVKSLPFSEKKFANKVLKRKKRERTESTTDLAAYMSNHNLFSYYENRKSITEAALMDKVKNPAKAGQKVKDDENLWVGDEFLWAQTGNSDYSMEHLLQKIMFLESKVGKMRIRVDNVITENAGKFSDLENLSLPGVISVSSTISSHNIVPSNGDRTIVGTDVSSHFMMEQCVVDEPVPESAATTTSHVTGSEKLARFADALKNGKDDVIVYKKKVKKQEKNDFEGLKSQPTQKPLTLKDGSGGSSAPLAEIPDMSTESQPPPKVRSIAKLTTTPAKNSMEKRGKRKCVGRGNPRFSS